MMLKTKRGDRRKFVDKHQGKHICQCGCGLRIPIRLHHFGKGIPRFINHHAGKIINGMRGKFGKDNPNFKGGRVIDRNGYVLILIGHNKATGRPLYELEHRIVMSRIIGRPLLEAETVHHKNGIRTDNREDNLELWCSEHPAGQRVSDLLKFAKEIIKRYGTDAS